MSLYNSNPFKSSPLDEFKASIIAVVVCGIALVVCGISFASGKEENAHKHARSLGLKNYKIQCDETPWACGCTITWEVDYGQRTEKFACCGWGCE